MKKERGERVVKSRGSRAVDGALMSMRSSAMRRLIVGMGKETDRGS